MDRRLFDRNDAFGITRYSHYDEDRDLLIVETWQDAQAIIDQNAAQRLGTDKHTRYGDGMQKVATIPLNILEDLMQKKVLVPGGDGEGNKRLRAWLNDADNRAFRTREGQV